MSEWWFVHSFTLAAAYIMTIRVNDQSREVSAGLVLADLVRDLGLADRKGVAVAIWPDTICSSSTRSAMRIAVALRCPSVPARLATLTPCIVTGLRIAIKSNAASTSASVNAR